MYCPYCGKELKTEGSFCPYCGRALDDEDDKGQKDGCRSGENRQWFYVCGSDRTGPVSLEEIKQLIGKGYIKRDTCVWNNSMGDWKEAGRVTELYEEFGAIAPSIPMKSVSSAYAWALATIPLLASYNACMLTSNEYIITAIAVGLNILFFALDCREINKSGDDPGNWIWTGLFLVPVYLFIRGKKMGRQYGYGVTWCILFVLTNVVFV